jgi:hypothetical protein
VKETPQSEKERYYMRTRLLIAGLIVLSVGALGQSPPPFATLTVQDKYLRQILITLGTPGKDPNLIQKEEKALASLLSLDTAEISTLESLAAQYGMLITTFRANRQSVIAANTTLSDANRATLDGYITTLDQGIGSLANAIMTSVRPRTSAQIAELCAGLGKAAANTLKGGK